MVSFRSRWLDYSPQTAKYATDKTDNTSSVSFGGEIVDHSEGKAGGCKVCNCTPWQCALALDCPVCRGAVCGLCGGCLSDRYRREKRRNHA